MSKRSRAGLPRTFISYLFTVGVCAAAAGGQYLLGPELDERFPFALFTAAVIAAAWYGTFSTGILATILSSALAAFFFLPPIRSFRVDGVDDVVGLMLFVFAGLLVSLAVRQLRRGAHEEHDIRVNTERRLRRTRQLQELTTALSRARTASDVIHACLPEVLHVVHGTAGAFIVVLNEPGGEYEVAYAIGYDEKRAVTGQRTPLGSKTLVTDAIRRHEITTVERRTERQAQDVAVDRFLALHQSAVVLPLLTGGRAVGAVALSFDEPHVIADDEREYLLEGGRRIAQAYERARLYEMAERARVEAEDFRARADLELRERQRMEAALRESEGRYRALAARTNRLYTLSASLSEAVTVAAVAKATVTHGKTVVGAAAGSVALLHGKEFETLYAEEFGHQNVESWHRFTAEAGLCATAAVETKRPVFVGSFAEWQKQYPRSASMVADGGFASAAALPLVVDNAVIGVLSFHFTAPVNFDEEYQALLTSVATHCGQALDRARLYEAAQRARADAEAANRSKDDFLSTISHELRTPLSAMLGWAAMLRDGILDEKRAHRAAEAVFTNATRQAHLIDELLDVSRIAAGRATLDLQEIDLAANVRGAVDAIMPVAEANEIELRMEDFPGGVLVNADARRLEQVFLNLLANAVKFTAAGGRVTVSAHVTGGTVAVRVSDTGRGIDPEFLPHVFERFQQADTTTARTAGGLGLGLFIARHLVEAHHGEIQVESAGLDKGAAFTVTLPITHLRAVADQPAPEPPRSTDTATGGSRLSGVRVLLVDDESDTREMMASALEASGATVMSAASARDALDHLTVSRDRIDVLLADIAMPGEDGYELIREVRSQPVARVARIPAAAVTACARDDERQRALAAGFQMHLAKPCAPATLVAAVAALASRENTPATSQA